jgi:hypothetical protein
MNHLAGRHRFQAGKLHSLSPLSPDPGLGEFIAPFVLPKGRPTAGDGGVACRRLLDVVDRQDGRGGDGFDGKRARHADLLLVDVGLIVEGLLVGMAGDCRVDVYAIYSILDLGIVGDRSKCDVGYRLVTETA